MNWQEKKIYGLIGYPIKHSLSPIMHNAAFRALKINAEYRLFEIKAKELNFFLKNFKKNRILGLNVTVPYKEIVLPFLNSLSKEARLIGAVNTIKVINNRLNGFNTDAEGFLRDLTADLKFNPKGKTISIIGAGGASRAISVYLSKAKPQGITIYDTDKTKREELVRRLKKNFKGIEFKVAKSMEELNIGNCDLLVNATPIGMKQSDPLLIDEKFMHKNLLVYDLIYNPYETKLLRLAKENGAKTANGLGMLLYQGALSFKIWTGRDAPLKVMRKALMEAMEK